VYDAAAAYELAFSYRNIPAEVDAVLGWVEPLVGRPVTSVLELAAGPAEHARELATRGLRATALDLEPAMGRYALARAAAQRVPLQSVVADMCDFLLADQFDLVIMMIDSIAHITSRDRLDQHFRCIAPHLTPGGCYVIELSHPADSLGDQTLTKSAWTQAGDAASVAIRWGEPGDPTDAATGVTSVTVSLDHRRNGQDPLVIRETIPQRAWLREELLASLGRVGGFEPRAWYGSFDGVALDAASAWRMLVVLQRC
jgi:SAM-dependent methyltransferase